MSTSQAPQSASLRLPAPYLFVGPPSQGPTSPGLRDAPTTARPPLQDQRPQPDDAASSADKPPALDARALRSAARTPATQPSPLQRRQDDRTEAIWAEMQQTLEAVQMTSAHGLGNVFGPEHARALAELRAAQVRLAEAWGRSEADDEAPGEAGGGAAPEQAKGEQAVGGGGGVLAKERGDKMGMEAGSRGKAAAGRTQLEEDTENDILLARERREANDRYFERVSKGVMDVVAKLDEVAARMKTVENESKEIWNEGDSLDGDTSG